MDHYLRWRKHKYCWLACHVGGQEQYDFSPLGGNFIFMQTMWTNFILFCTPTSQQRKPPIGHPMGAIVDYWKRCLENYIKIARGGCEEANAIWKNFSNITNSINPFIRLPITWVKKKNIYLLAQVKTGAPNDGFLSGILWNTILGYLECL